MILLASFLTLPFSLFVFFLNRNVNLWTTLGDITKGGSGEWRSENVGEISCAEENWKEEKCSSTQVHGIVFISFFFYVDENGVTRKNEMTFGRHGLTIEKSTFGFTRHDETRIPMVRYKPLTIALKHQKLG